MRKKYPFRSLTEIAGWIKKQCARRKCHRPFWVIPSQPTLLYCSAECRHLPWEERLWMNVVKGEKEDDCWSFALKANCYGYPYLKKDGTEQRVSRLMWELHHGPIPDGLIIRHTCDRPPCVNISHLLVGTQKENIQDMIARGRHVGNRILSDDQVREIRALEGKMDPKDVAVRYGIAWQTVYNVWLRYNRGDVPD